MLKGRVSWGKMMLWRPEGSEVFVVLLLILLLYTKPKILLHFHREIPEWLLQIKFKSGSPWDFNFSILFLWVGIRTPHQRSALACFFSDSGPRWRWGTDTALVGYMCSPQPQNSAWAVLNLVLKPGRKSQPYPQEAEYEVRLDNKVEQGWTLVVSLDFPNGLCAAWLLGIFLVVSFKCIDDNLGGTTLCLRGIKERKAETLLWSCFTKFKSLTSLPVSSVGL